MKSPFPYSDDNKRYHTWNYYLRHQFGGKVCKVPLNAGFTCPNLDGTKGTGGCTYCSAGSGAFAGDPAQPLPVQYASVRERLLRKWPQAKSIAYFQANTNTYAPLPVLRQKFEEVLEFPGVVGLSIATRADCITPEIAAYLGNLSRRSWLMVELGLQSVFDRTGERINRCHSWEEFLTGYRLLQEQGIRICVHLINGLPGETPEMMLHSARTVAALRPHSVKLHLLHVLRGTAMARQLEAGEFSLLTLPEYVRIICDQLEVFHPDTVIQRVTGDGAKDDLIGPLWSLKKFVVMNEIDKELLRRDSMQGKEWRDDEADR